MKLLSWLNRKRLDWKQNRPKLLLLKLSRTNKFRLRRKLRSTFNKMLRWKKKRKRRIVTDCVPSVEKILGNVAVKQPRIAVNTEIRIGKTISALKHAASTTTQRSVLRKSAILSTGSLKG